MASLLVSIGALVGASVIVVVLLTAAKRRSGLATQGFKVEYRRQSMMTATEQKFFLRLTQALPEAVVAPQVAMSALVGIAPRQNQGKFKHTNRAKFAQRRLDFVLVDRSTGEVVCVVELDDRTHDSPEAKVRDAERDAILEQVGYGVLRFDARCMPSVDELRQHFAM